MAYINTAKPGVSLINLIARPFVAVFNVLVVIAEAHPKMAAVNKLNALSDEELAARGTDRSEEVRRIFSSQFYL